MKNITPSTDQPLEVPDKPKRISKKVRSAIDALVAGDVKTIADAARSVGLSREHLSRELSRPHIAEHMRQRVVRSLSVASARAGAVKAELLDLGGWASWRMHQTPVTRAHWPQRGASSFRCVVQRVG